MKPLFGKIFHSVSAATALMLGISRRVDYRTLNRYILEINMEDDIVNILRGASNCLKEILNYKLFAVAVQCDKGVDVWIDPSLYKKSFERMIKGDPAFEKGLPITYLNKDDEYTGPTAVFNEATVISHELSGADFTAKLYIIPERRMLPYHAEIMGVIAQTISIALSNFLSIQRLENAASIDPLTRCYNRREFDKQIERHIANASRHGAPLSVFLMDLDHFKAVNDTHGHQAGDEVLKRVAQAIQTEIRTGDVLSRYGGEEFVALLPETGRERAMEIAERLRKVIEKLDIRFEGESIRVTASFGVSALTPGCDKERLIKEADAMLYKAKANGRNVVMPGLIKLCRLDETERETAIEG
jgi:diguanylate cyclase (GGDEF)-like protein